MSIVHMEVGRVTESLPRNDAYALFFVKLFFIKNFWACNFGPAAAAPATPAAPAPTALLYATTVSLYYCKLDCLDHACAEREQ